MLVCNKTREEDNGRLWYFVMYVQSLCVHLLSEGIGLPRAVLKDGIRVQILHENIHGVKACSSQESYDWQQQQGVAEAKDDEDGNNEESAKEEKEKSGDEEDNGNNNNENDNDEREEEETPEIFQRRTRSMAPPKSANSSRQSVRRRIQTTPDS